MTDKKHDDEQLARDYEAAMDQLYADHLRKTRNLRRWDVVIKALIVTMVLGTAFAPMGIMIIQQWWR